jgi:hypothetical protein
MPGVVFLLHYLGDFDRYLSFVSLHYQYNSDDADKHPTNPDLHKACF